MRILFVTNRYPTKRARGDSPCIEQQRGVLQRRGYTIDLLYINSRKNKLNYLNGIWHIFWNSQIRKKYDIIHAHYGGYCGVIARFQFACPVVVTFRGSDVFRKSERPLSQLAARWADRSIVMNEQMMQALNSENIQIIPYGIDMDLFKPVDQADARSELKLPQNIPLVFFPYDPARALKRYDLVEQAVASVCKVLPDVRLISIYDKPQPVVAQYMNACDTLVLASDWEGAPVTIREAMACNLPIVSVDVGDAKQIIGDTDGCYICERTADDIALNLLKVLKARKRTNGRQAVNVYSVDKATEKVTAIYQQLAVKNQLRSQN